MYILEVEKKSTEKKRQTKVEKIVVRFVVRIWVVRERLRP